jgi:hypothetical protein
VGGLGGGEREEIARRKGEKRHAAIFCHVFFLDLKLKEAREMVYVREVVYVL